MPTSILKLRKPKSQTAKFICGSDIVPEEWSDWFWGLISSDAPFSWGDNNRTLVTMDRFIDHVKDVVCVGENDVTEEELDEYISFLEKFGPLTYIDLEN